MDNLETYWVFEFAIIPGRFEDLKTLMAAIVDATQKNEPGTLNYEWAISDERQVCHVYERYQDSAAPHDPSGVEGWPRRIGPRLHGALRGL
jgi:quinol monooxygenase YgiN